MTITLPLPPKPLMPNWRSRVHWARTNALKAYRNVAWGRALEALGGKHKAPQWARATTQATFYLKVRREHDADNLAASLKAAWDGLADAGLVTNDKGFTHLPPIVLIDRVNPRVELCVEQAS